MIYWSFAFNSLKKFKKERFLENHNLDDDTD